jgi:phosphoglycolate phosphatase
MDLMKQLTKSVTPDFLASIDTFLVDCDGVIWRGNTLIDGAQEALAQLRKQGKRVFFVTNNSTKSRAQYVKKFHKLGIQASEEEIVGTAYVAAHYLTNNLGYRGKVYLVGGEGLKEEFNEAQVQYIGPGPDPILEDGYRVDDWVSLQLDPDVGAVVVGFDEHFSYRKMIKAASYINKPGCIFIGTNEDAFLPVPAGEIVVPGTGCLVTAVAMASQRSPIYVGKPHKPMFELLQNQ